MAIHDLCNLEYHWDCHINNNQMKKERGYIMHTVIRSYSGSGATALFDLLEERKEEVESLIRAVTGFVSYSLVRTADGGVSVTVCQDKGGTDESLQLARDWIQEHGSNLDVSPPTVTEGSNILQMS